MSIYADRERWAKMASQKAAAFGAPEMQAIRCYGRRAHKAFQPAENQPFQIVGYATTEDVDLEGEVILADGIDVDSYFRKNGAIFADHEYDAMNAVGKLRDIERVPGGLILTTVLCGKKGMNPVRDWVEVLAREYQIGYSVLCLRKDSGRPTADEARRFPGAKRVTRTSTLVEVSYTALPMNGAAQAWWYNPTNAPESERSEKAVRKTIILG
jgi:hypothetical protein